MSKHSFANICYLPIYYGNIQSIPAKLDFRLKMRTSLYIPSFLFYRNMANQRRLRFELLSEIISGLQTGQKDAWWWSGNLLNAILDHSNQIDLYDHSSISEEDIQSK